MTRWQQVETLFHQALDLPPDTRSTELLRLAAGDQTLVQEVLDLLQADAVVEEKMQAIPARPDEEDPWLGRQLGPYTLRTLLGQGGMGVVYLAERPHEVKPVALKLVRRNLHGSPAQQHFLLERDALARLEHPNIARLLDGGLTPDGLPYLVMEYVEGRRLDLAADDPACSIETVLGYMQQLCAAVSYVHRNLILHRDLKPGNVMVAADGTVKLLDFGTLKLIGPDAHDSEMTQAGVRPLTLRYASPEAILSRSTQPSTATDIYSLGVILYRMIAGQLPRAFDLPVGEYLDRLSQGRIPPPSTLATRPMPRALAHDLDAITLQAMRFEPEARYASAEALSAELQRALDRRPVQARGASRRYRAARFFARNRFTLAATAAALLVLAAGLAAMTHQARVARAQQLRAQAGVEQERKLAHFLLFDYFEQLKQLPGSTNAQRQAVSQSLNYLAGLSKTSLDTDLQLDSIQAYTEMGALLGSPYEENLGDVPGAIRTLERGVAQSQQLLLQAPTSLPVLQSATAAQLALGRVYFGSGDPHHAAEYLIPAAQTASRIATLPQADAPILAQAASVVDTLGDVYGQEGAASLGDPTRAVQTYGEAQRIDAAGLRKDSTCNRCRRGIAVEDWKMGMLTPDPAAARTLFEAGLQTLATLPPSELSTTRVIRLDTVLRQRLGTAYLHSGRVPEGLAMLEEVRQRFLHAIAADPVDDRARFDLVALDYSRSEDLAGLNRLPDAAEAIRELLSNVDILLHQDPKNVIWQFSRAQALLTSGRLQSKLGNRQAGHEQIAESIQLLTRLAEDPNAAANILSKAADALSGPEAQQDQGLVPGPNLALTFAHRAIAATPNPTPAQYATLARARVQALPPAQVRFPAAP